MQSRARAEPQELAILSILTRYVFTAVILTEKRSGRGSGYATPRQIAEF